MKVFSLSARSFLSGLPIRLIALGVGLPVAFVINGCSRPAESDRADASEAVAAANEASDERVVAMKPAVSFKDEPTTDQQPILPLESGTEEEPKPLEDPPETLGIGDINPGLQIAKWFKGDPIEGPLTGKVHVVEFWATWCGPCRVGMPHISELQSKFADEVAFIGVTREDESKVQGFLASSSPSGETWDDVIQYRLAVDDRNWTNTAYMKAAGQTGIPCAFVVGQDGVIEWIGHPASIDEPLERIVSGSWDRQAAVAEFRQKQRLKQSSREISRLARAGDWEGALQLLDAFEEEMGQSSALVNYRLRLLRSAGRAEEASTALGELIDLDWDNANSLNEVAWNTATSGDPSEDDLRLALKAAVRASELRDGKDPPVLDTLARCHYELGDLAEAIKWQREAVEQNHGKHRQIDSTLQKYLREQEAEQGEASSDDKTADP